jgi:glycosyltransferase involved in cell wall biosynthesis
MAETYSIVKTNTIKMKLPLVVINGRFLTKTVTGVQRYATQMVLALQKLPCRFRFVVIAPHGPLVSKVPNLIQDNFPVGGHIWEQIRLPYLLKKVEADILWCPGNTAPISNYDVKLILSLHDASLFAGPEWFSLSFRLYYHLMMPLMIKGISKIITVSEFSRQELSKYNLVRKDSNIEVIYCGLTSFKNKQSDKGIEKLQNTKYVLSLGSRDPRKNISRLLLAWNNMPHLLKTGRILAITGNASSAFAKEKFAIIPKDVVFLGYISDEHLYSLYSHADAFIFPSLYEGFGMPPLEAMSCGTPVLASNKGALPEICGNAALYCDPYNLDDMVTKLIQLLTDKSLVADLRKRGVERAKYFNWEKSARQMIDVFEEVLYG